MSATEAAALPAADGGGDSLQLSHDTQDVLLNAVLPSGTSSPLSDVEDTWVSQIPDAGLGNDDDDGERVVKLEKENDGPILLEHTTPTTLRPDPLPSKKRRQSEVDHTIPDIQDDKLHNKKRKRGPSPPWQFPTAATTTLKTVDGRRASARVNTSTPDVHPPSETSRARSSSVSASQQPRPRVESPPWKKFEAQGPTTVVVDGKRMSGRVNKELTQPPKRVSPRSKKVEHKGGASQGGVSHGSAAKAVSASKALNTVVNGANTKQHSSSLKKSTSKNLDTPLSPSDSASKIAELRAQINALKPSRSFPSPERSKHKTSTTRERTFSNDSAIIQMDGPASPPQTKKLPPATTSAISPDNANRPSPKIKLRFTRPRAVIPPPHPHAKFPSPVRPPSLSLFQTIESYELQELQQPYSENERGPPDSLWFAQRAERQAVEEGAMRRRILREAEPGGKLSREHLSIYRDVEVQAEPPKQYGHADHLVAHALHLRHLQLREKTQHRLLAKRVAHEAMEFWKAMRGPTEEEKQEEEAKMWRLIYRQVVVDVKGKWEMVRQFVMRRRVEVWEREEEVKRQERLREKLEWSENLVARLRGEGSEDDEDDNDDDEEDSESGEENMSESSSEDDENEDAHDEKEEGEMGEEELKAYLAQRESEGPIEDDVEDSEEHDEVDDTAEVSMAEMLDSHTPSEHQLEEADASMADLLFDEGEDEPDNEFQPENDTPSDAETPADYQTDTEHSLRRSRVSSTTPAIGEDEFSSDESTDMDSTDYDSDEDMSSTGEEDNAGDEDDAADDEDVSEQRVPKNSLLSLFKEEIREATKATGLPTPTTSAEGDDGERQTEAVTVPTTDADEEVADVGDDSHDAIHDAVEPTVKEQQEDISPPATAPESPPAESVADEEKGESDEEETTSGKHLVPSPDLLRGTLRSYQHAGVDWLASLYRNGTNGILADEMGLGKTIQTIALFAHLAEELSVWEAHLVIVPTSVVLNWVTEFQRFLPGFRVLGYYGSSEERQLKRKGWVNDPHHENKEKRGYNVVITSYNVAMQDINAIRNVQWHYLVLDEAHNIRNFNSQRWQVLIRLKTRARLLLTGTPLQNSLTELWSLLTFLTAGDDDPQHGDLEEFLSHWKEPVKEIFDRGVQSLSAEAQRVVDQLHVSLRPFLLRRLKSEVEKDLPKKTERVVVCKLSKRQRQLYQEYMGLAETRRSLTQGNAVTAGKVLLSLRRVCNHPDLFDPRPIQTSWGMERGVVEGFQGKEGIVRRLLGVKENELKLRSITAFEDWSRAGMKRAKKLDASAVLEKEAEELDKSISSDRDADPSTLAGCQMLQRVRLREKKLEQLRSCIHVWRYGLEITPVYGSDLRELLTIQHNRPYRVVAKDIRGRVIARHLRGWPALGNLPLKFEMDHVSDWEISKTSLLQRNVQTLDGYAERLHDTIVRFTFCTPAVTAPVLDFAISPKIQQNLRTSPAYPLDDADYAHEARIRTSIVFPDSRLLIYDAGKLQRLTLLLRDLQSRGSRSLIFTQMTGTLNILEQFLSLLNLPYLRLDGSTPVERRQLYSAEFNRPDSKYQCMILSSRAGGVGLNLVGASSVIFYDLDWNPQMDRQCMDRAHRIGQVRDVEVYKMVSEKTVEENILRRADQKSLLDRAVIQEGHFTTEYGREQRVEARESEEEGEEEADVAAGIERFLGGVVAGAQSEKVPNQAMDSVEDREDVAAAAQARKEELVDEADFAEKPSGSKGPSGPPTPGHIYAEGDGEQEEEGRMGHLDSWLIEMMEFLLKGVPFVPPSQVQGRRKDKHGRDVSHRKRKR